MEIKSIIQGISLVDVASQFIDLKKKGAHRYFGLSPFKIEKTPSFVVNTLTNKYKCFSSGYSGDAIDLVMRIKGLNFKESIELLTGMEITKTQNIEPEIKFVEAEIMRKSCNIERYSDNPFAVQFINKFGAKAAETLKAYNVGTAANSKTVFWYVNEESKILNAKVFTYGENLKRSKQIPPYYQFKSENGYSCACLFGAHLMNKKPNSIVALVESEKTALICNEVMKEKDFIWLSFGGKSALTQLKCKSLKNRNIVIFPDCETDGSSFRFAESASEFLRIIAKSVEICRQYINEPNGTDLADILLRSN